MLFVLDQLSVWTKTGWTKIGHGRKQMDENRIGRKSLDQNRLDESRLDENWAHDYSMLEIGNVNSHRIALRLFIYDTFQSIYHTFHIFICSEL